jgi:uncharacterized membrane protein
MATTANRIGQTQYGPLDDASAPTAPTNMATGRIASLDIIRGAVMVLMAIDHVRVFAGVPAGGPTPGVFFTRWVTHFCAPVFFFLAGTAAYLHGRKLANTGALSRFLVTRGAWLILLELTVLRFGWTFNLDYQNFTFAGVIWALGWSMIVLALLVKLPNKWIAAVGIGIIVLHNLVGGLIGDSDGGGSALAPLWQILYLGGEFTLGSGGPNVVVLYVLLPWIGVIAAGYAFGVVMVMEPAPRRRLCLQIGLGATAAFLVLRGLDVYGDPRPWRQGPPPPAQAPASAPGAAAPAASGAPAAAPAPPNVMPPRAGPPAALRFLNTTKYPASLLFLLMTLGPTIALIPLLERARRRVAGWLSVFGRVPFFYYVLHIPLIHVVAVLIALVRTPESLGWLFANHPMRPPDVPDGYRYSLSLLYLVTAGVVTALYFPCHWFAALKARRRDLKILQYL